jgi:hypothetical protein
MPEGQEEEKQQLQYQFPYRHRFPVDRVVA